jgi:hypothetical protein
VHIHQPAKSAAVLLEVMDLQIGEQVQGPQVFGRGAIQREGMPAEILQLLQPLFVFELFFLGFCPVFQLLLHPLGYFLRPQGQNTQQDQGHQ